MSTFKDHTPNPLIGPKSWLSPAFIFTSLCIFLHQICFSFGPFLCIPNGQIQILERQGRTPIIYLVYFSFPFWCRISRMLFLQILPVFEFFSYPSHSRTVGMDFFSFPYPPFCSVLLQISGNDSHRFPFPKCGNGFLQSRPRTSGMELAIPVLKLPLTPASWKNNFLLFLSLSLT